MSNHISSYCSYPTTVYALCSMEPEVLFPLQCIPSFSFFPHSQPLYICHASYTLLIRVTAAQLPPRRGRLWTNSFLCSQLSQVCMCCPMGNVVPVPLSHLTPFCSRPLPLLSSTLPSCTLSLQISPVGPL